MYGSGPTFSCLRSASNTSASASADYSAALEGSPCCAGAAPAAPAETPDFKLGTGYGQVREDVVSEASFERGLELATFEIYYSDEASLTAAGVVMDKSAQISKPVPQAFGGFCRPPSVSV